MDGRAKPDHDNFALASDNGATNKDCDLARRNARC